MDLRKLKTLIDLVQQSDIAELEITEGEEKVRISRFGGASAPVMMAHAPQPMMQMPAVELAEAAPPSAPEPVAEEEGH
ncbi:MAG: acetyl-CoA carboxylase biotin carboxyl carrier protein, partial [Burkholderiales bacterium]